MNDTRASNKSTNQSGKHKRSANWGGARTNAGRKRKKLLPTATSSPSQAASAVVTGSHVNPLGPAVPSALPSVPAQSSRVPAVGFFAPRLGIHVERPAVPMGQSNNAHLTPSGIASQGDGEGMNEANVGSHGGPGMSPPRIHMT